MGLIQSLDPATFLQHYGKQAGAALKSSPTKLTSWVNTNDLAVFRILNEREVELDGLTGIPRVYEVV